MKTLALLSIWLALPLAAQDAQQQTPLTSDEHDSYVLMVIQDLVFQNALYENLRAHKAGNDDLDNRDRAHTERLNALKQLITAHHACEGGDWNIAKKDWACPQKAK